MHKCNIVKAAFILTVQANSASSWSKSTAQAKF